MSACLIGALLAAPLSGQAANAPCDNDALDRIPDRPARAPDGHEFTQRVGQLSGIARDALVRAELLSGNIPSFLRTLVPVRLQRAGKPRAQVTVCVLPDYLAIGSDRDFLRVPMGLKTALEVAERFGFELPTPKMVDAIYAEAAVKLSPQPLPAGDRMRTTAYLVEHDALIELQRTDLHAPLGLLTAGHKKDLVLTERLWQFPGQVAIYGWHRAVDAPIQPLSTVHGARYADYSHGVRLVSDTAYVDGRPRRLRELLGDPRMAGVLTRTGSLPSLDAQLHRLIARMQ